jgi:ATP-dependent protease ClpP protease subunit
LTAPEMLSYGLIDKVLDKLAVQPGGARHKSED